MVIFDLERIRFCRVGAAVRLSETAAIPKAA
jgi:hypothetical protein